MRVAVLDVVLVVRGSGWDGPVESFMDREGTVSPAFCFCVLGRGAISNWIEKSVEGEVEGDVGDSKFRC